MCCFPKETRYGGVWVKIPLGMHSLAYSSSLQGEETAEKSLDQSSETILKVSCSKSTLFFNASNLFLNCSLHGIKVVGRKVLIIPWFHAILFQFE